MEYLTKLVAAVAGDVWTTIVHNWPYLLLSVIVASIVQVHNNSLRHDLLRRRNRRGSAVNATLMLVLYLIFRRIRWL